MAANLSAREIIAYDDDQLDKYLEENNRVVTVDDPENLPGSFIQRLRDRSHVEGRPGLAPSRPANMDEVSAKLTQALTRPRRRRIPSPSSDLSLDSEDMKEKEIQWEEDAYEALMSEGGRPLYDIDKLRDVAADPSAHIDLWLPWHHIERNPVPEKSWDVLSMQRRHWDFFQMQRWRARETAEGLATANEESRKRRLMVGLDQHFTFLKDKTRQDKATTWAEYLDYTLRLYVQHGHDLERFQQERNRTRARYLNWMLDQFPLIDKEAAEAGASGSSGNSSSKSKNNRSGDGHNNKFTSPTTFTDPSASAPPRKHKRGESAGEGRSVDATLTSSKEKGSSPPVAKRPRASRPHRTSVVHITTAAAASSSATVLASTTNVPKGAAAKSAPSAAAPRQKRARAAAAPLTAAPRRSTRVAAAAAQAAGPRRSERVAAAEREKAQQEAETAAARRKAATATVGAGSAKAGSARTRQTRKPATARVAQRARGSDEQAGGESKPAAKQPSKVPKPAVKHGYG